ncbi:MAG: hypothetical protein Q9167_008050 [Letrouitia subvulpina]
MSTVNVSVPSRTITPSLSKAQWHPAPESQFAPFAGCWWRHGRLACTKKRDNIKPDMREFAPFDHSLSTHIQPTLTQWDKHDNLLSYGSGIPSAQSILTHARPTGPSSLYSDPLLSLIFKTQSTTAQESQVTPLVGCWCESGVYVCTKKRDNVKPNLGQLEPVDHNFSTHVQPIMTQWGKGEYELPLCPRSLNDKGSTNTGILLSGSTTTSSSSLYVTYSSTFSSMTSSPLNSILLINSPTSTTDAKLYSTGESLDKPDKVAAIIVSITSFCLIMLLLVLLRKRFLRAKKASAIQRQSKRMIDEPELGFAAYEDHVDPQKIE